MVPRKDTPNDRIQELIARSQALSARTRELGEKRDKTPKEVAALQESIREGIEVCDELTRLSIEQVKRVID